MIYCIWYPPGGFGHYVASVINLYGQDFKRPSSSELTFSTNGNSHNLVQPAPKYIRDSDSYSFDFDQKYNYAVLIDNGNNTSRKFEKFFPDAKIIKIVYNDWSWPIIAHSMIHKALDQNFEDTLGQQLVHWRTKDPWAVRENYFLYLRDHKFRNFWPVTQDFSLDLLDVVDYSRLVNKLTDAKIELENFYSTHNRFLASNQHCIKPVLDANKIVSALLNQKDYDLSEFKNSNWTQAVVYYYIWIKFGVEVPHNDYSNWFTNTQDIITMLNNHGVTVDQS
jgi:hypothetical protein